MAFQLVQRLTEAPDGRPQNILGDPTSLQVSKLLLEAGSKVDLDYMGSWEYSDPEILIRSANQIARVAQSLKIVTRQVVSHYYEEDVNFVCTNEQEKVLLPKWDEWTHSPLTKEPTGYFPEDRELYREVVGWWALGEDLIWTRQQETAENVRNAFVAVASHAVS